MLRKQCELTSTICEFIDERRWRNYLRRNFPALDFCASLLLAATIFFDKFFLESYNFKFLKLYLFNGFS